MGTMLIHVPLMPLGGWSFDFYRASMLSIFVCVEGGKLCLLGVHETHETGTGVLLCPPGNTLTQCEPLFFSFSKHLCIRYHDTVALNEHVNFLFSRKMLKQVKTICHLW